MKPWIASFSGVVTTVGVGVYYAGNVEDATTPASASEPHRELLTSFIRIGRSQNLKAVVSIQKHKSEATETGKNCQDYIIRIYRFSIGGFGAGLRRMTC